MIQCWDIEIDFGIIKAEAVKKKKKIEKMEISKLGNNSQRFFKVV